MRRLAVRHWRHLCLSYCNYMQWPSVENIYADEFGLVDPEVCAIAGQIWPAAEKLALLKLGDEQIGFRLMIRAVAYVSRKTTEPHSCIRNLRAYLWQSYSHLVYAELKKMNLHRRLEDERSYEMSPTTQELAEELDRRIFINQLLQRMDRWTRKVFDWLVLGYGYDIMENELGMKANAIRAKFSKRMNRLRQEIDKECHEAEHRVRCTSRLNQ